MMYRRYVAIAVVLVGAWLLRDVLLCALKILAGGAVIALAISPLQSCLEKRLPRMLSIIAAWLVVLVFVAALVVAVVCLILPQAAALKEIWPRAKGLLSMVRMDTLLSGGQIIGLVSQISQTADAMASLGMMWVISIFLLSEKEKYLLMAELAIPLRHRRQVLRVLGRIRRELKMFISGQAVVAVCVGGLTGMGLMLIGLPGAPVLGCVAAVLNMIPYFGPVFAAVPVVVVALSEGLTKAALAGGVLILVQQIDGMVISPKVLSGATGLSPVCVLVALAVGGGVMGVPGMLLAIPGAIVVRIVAGEWIRTAVNREQN